MSHTTLSVTSSDQLRHSASVSDRGVWQPLAFDGGFGIAKCIFNKQLITTPALIAPVRGHLHDIPTSRTGGLVTYLEGPREDLQGTRWMTGFPAYQYFPQAHFRTADTPEGKLTYGLQILLGCLATLPYKPLYHFNVVASIQDAQVMGERLAAALNGTHRVQLANYPPSTLTFKVSRVFEESFGVIAAHSNLLRQSRQTVVFDLGYGTTIASLFAENGSLAQRQVIPMGVGKLIGSIAANPLVRKTLSRPGDIVLIREAIERGDFIYGTTDYCFEESYRAELAPWIEAVLAPAMSAASPWLASAERFVAIGGGSQLPVIADVLKAKGLQPVKNGAHAHVQGLYLLATAAAKAKSR